MVLFYCDLSVLSSPPSNMPSSLKVERHANQTNLSPQDLQEITSFWNPDLARRKIKKRFDLGASLWLIKFEGNLAGYGWTLQGAPSSLITSPWGRTMCSFSISMFSPSIVVGHSIGF